MGIIERFGRIADTYVSEKEQLLGAEEERRRVHTGHGFWPTEVLRDTIIFASIVMVIAFYSWIIPPPCTMQRIRTLRLVSSSLIGTFCSLTDT